MTMSKQRESHRSAKETKLATPRFGHGSVSSAIVGLVVLALWEKCGVVPVHAWNHAAVPRSVSRSRIEECTDDARRRAIIATFAGSFCCTIMSGSEKAVAAMTTAMDGDDNESSPTPSQVPPSNRPRAPTEALVPATQQRLLLGKAVCLANLLVHNGDNSSKEQNDRKVGLLDQLKEMFEPPAPSTARKNAAAVTSKLSGAALRAAMDVYTANLQFGESYTLTASPSIKKELIRKYDGLPDVKQVITADLDLRDLYRNQAQTTIEDIQAELYRQEPDPAELLVLLADAMTTYDLWFALISENDIRKALQLAE
jgi:hypothetical protein